MYMEKCEKKVKNSWVEFVVEQVELQSAKTSST